MENLNGAACRACEKYAFTDESEITRQHTPS